MFAKEFDMKPFRENGLFREEHDISDDNFVEIRAESNRRPHCPKCGSSDARRSRRAGLLAAFMQTLGLRPFRCRSCRSRFYRRPLTLAA
jgi:formate dehydrogenase maturation protein FdhE